MSFDRLNLFKKRARDQTIGSPFSNYLFKYNSNTPLTKELGNDRERKWVQNLTLLFTFCSLATCGSLETCKGTLEDKLQKNTNNHTVIQQPDTTYQSRDSSHYLPAGVSTKYK